MSFFSWVQEAISGSSPKGDEEGLSVSAGFHSERTKSTAGRILRTSDDPDAKALAASILANSKEGNPDEG